MGQTLAEIADDIEQRALKLWAEGKKDAAWELILVALDSVKAYASVKSLPLEAVSDNLQQMTGAQLVRRGKAIAKGRAAASNDELLRAIAASHWGSQDAYARKRLKVSPGSLTAYRKGETPCPRPIAARVMEDLGKPALGEELGIPADYWTRSPRSVVD